MKTNKPACEKNRIAKINSKTNKSYNKRKMIVFAYAVVDSYTMMVVVFYAFFADHAMKAIFALFTDAVRTQE